MAAGGQALLDVGVHAVLDQDVGCGVGEVADYPAGECLSLSEVEVGMEEAGGELDQELWLLMAPARSQDQIKSVVSRPHGRCQRVQWPASGGELVRVALT